MDNVPGATITRYCSSSVQTTRMAFHAIKAGEGDVFISRRRRDRVPLRQGHLRPPPRHPEPAVRRRRGPHRRPTPRAAQDWHDPREDGVLPDVYIAMGQTAENVARMQGPLAPGAGRVRRPQSRTSPRRPSPTASGPRRSPRSRCPTARSSPPTTARAPASRYDAVSQLKPVFRPDGVVTAGNCCPLNDGAAAVVDHVRHQGRRARPHPAGADRLHRRHRAVAGDHGPRPGRGVPPGAGPRRHEHRRHRPRRDQRGVRRPGRAVLPGPRHRPRQAQRQRRRDRRRPPLRHDRRPHHSRR